MDKKHRIWIALFSTFAILGINAQSSHCAQFKVLAVMSYSEQMLWEQEVKF